MTDLDYWKECIGIAADECDLSMAEEQLSYIADSVSSGHENYGMAFYSPLHLKGSATSRMNGSASMHRCRPSSISTEVMPRRL